MHNPVQDLAFIIHSDLIYQGFDLSPYWVADLDNKLAQLAHNPATLLAHLAKAKSHFLGSYFESLFSYAIQELSSLTIVFEHEQITEAGKTLGEVDILVKTPQGQFYQFELAIKFYLQTRVTAENNEIEHWLGPNKHDSFQQKYQRAQEHQLKILTTLAGQTLLAKHLPSKSQHQVATEIPAYLLMFGFLYQHLPRQEMAGLLPNRTIYQNNIHREPLINKKSIQGYWCFMCDLIGLAPQFIAAQELTKQEWLCQTINPVLADAQLDEQSQALEHDMITNFTDFEEQISNTFLQDSRPKHILLTLGQSGSLIEEQQWQIRLFIVPNGW